MKSIDSCKGFRPFDDISNEDWLAYWNHKQNKTVPPLPNWIKRHRASTRDINREIPLSHLRFPK